MNDLSICRTSEADIDAIVAMEIEIEIENSQFIFPNTKEEHYNLIIDEDIEHLVLKSKNNETSGFVILAGVKSKSKIIEFRRIVIKEKGKGFGRMAIRAIKDYCFEQLSCHRLWLDVLETNDRARHLYRSEGFKEEGKLRDCILINGKYNSLILMSLLENEYEELEDTIKMKFNNSKTEQLNK